MRWRAGCAVRGRRARAVPELRPAYDRAVSSGREEIDAELERLRKLERGLRDERERMRAEAADEVAGLQAALRETAAHAAEREREVERLKAQRERHADDRAPRRALRRGHGEPDPAAALDRVRAVFERDREELEERARAVAETERRQRATEAELRARAERIARAAGVQPERRGASEELELAAQRIDELERRLAENERPVPPAIRESPGDASTELERLRRELVRREEAVTQREIQLAIVRRRVGEEERRLQERVWRAGASRGPAGGSAVSFSEGWRLLSGAGRRGEEETGGSW